MIMSGGLYFPDGERHFVELGDEVVNYQRPQRDWAFKYVTDWGRAIDVGANVGIFSRHFAERFEEVWAFEPVPPIRECLALNVPPNVRVLPYALGKAAETQRMFHTLKNSGGSFICSDPSVPAPDLAIDSSHVYDVEVRTLDGMGVTGVGLVKLDIQGSECNALLGATETLSRFRPVVLIEEKPTGGPGGDVSHIAEAAAILTGIGMTPKEKVGADRIYIFQ